MPPFTGGLRQRFTLWWGDREVIGAYAVELGLAQGGPFVRDVAVERAAEQLMRINPRAPIRIDREELQLVEDRGAGTPTTPTTVQKRWVNTGTVWSNPHAPQ